MTADRRAFTIVIAFFGVLILGIWIVHAWSLVTEDNSRADGSPAQVESMQE